MADENLPPDSKLTTSKQRWAREGKFLRLQNDHTELPCFAAEFQNVSIFGDECIGASMKSQCQERLVVWVATAWKSRRQLRRP